MMLQRSSVSRAPEAVQRAATAYPRVNQSPSLPAGANAPWQERAAGPLSDSRRQALLGELDISIFRQDGP